MRWPLRHQIMLPMAAVMLLSVVAVGGWGALLAVDGAQERIASQIAGVTRILEQTNYPLTNGVLQQMQELSGADFVLVDTTGDVVASSAPLVDFSELLRNIAGAPAENTTLGERKWLGGRGYFHSVVELAGRRGGRNESMLHILYPEVEYRRAWQRAIVPSVVFVVIALPAIVLLAGVTAARIGRRVSRLQGQVDQIAEGDFRQLALPERDDEIRALGQSVNRMAKMLARYETEVRRTERMRTLAHLGGGIAHQLRNSATGCGLALDLHAEECPIGPDCESLDVAKRQLRLMEEYLQRFLQLGRPSSAAVKEVVDLAAMIDNLIPLVAPAARHAGVELRWGGGPYEASVLGDAHHLRQLLLNLFMNAVEAAGQGKAQGNLAAKVAVDLTSDGDGWLRIHVIDSGPGPAETVRGEIFEPFITEKPDGVGLGLSVARDVAEAHGGRIDWRRVGDRTIFVVELPKESKAESNESRLGVNIPALDYQL
jgi:signal transduction histidine kinase